MTNQTKTLIALADMNGRYEAWYSNGRPEHFTIEEITHPEFIRLYADNLAQYEGLKIIDGNDFYSYRPSSALAQEPAPEPANQNTQDFLARCRDQGFWLTAEIAQSYLDEANDDLEDALQLAGEDYRPSRRYG